MGIISGAAGLFEIVDDPATITSVVNNKNGIIAYMADRNAPCIGTVLSLLNSASHSDRILKQLSARDLRLLYVDVDDKDLMQQSPHRIDGVPTFYAHIPNKRQVGKFVGRLDADVFIDLLKRWYGLVIIPAYGSLL